ncbi:hypothetical protein AFB00_14180 [Pseudonocardia sp. HH130630-07]|nr:hypothetical protein AFB00_14180 [Pseudonocardia sp. HH130630-07]
MRPAEQRDRFVDAVLANPVNAAILERGDELGAGDWWLTGGAVFQTVWNVLTGRDPAAGIADYDFFYFDDADLSWSAEDRVIRRAAELFADLDGVVEVRNEARVHLWYEAHFGRPAPRFTSATDAIDHFVAVVCCYGVRRTPAGDVAVHAPHGFDDLFGMRVRPNPVLAPRSVYEAKARRWASVWPELDVQPWPAGDACADAAR